MEPARAGLHKIMSDLLSKQPPEEAAVLAWPLVCGKEVAARTRALTFAAGSLTIEVPDRTWRGELSALAPRYVSGLAGLIGPVVREIVFSIQRQAKPGPG